MAAETPGGDSNKRTHRSPSPFAGQGWKWLSVVLLLILLDLVIVFTWRKKVTPENPEWLDRMNRGLALLEQFRYPQAINQFEMALEIKPKDVQTRINLAVALLNEAKPETLARSIELLNGVLLEQPDNVRAHYCLGMILQYQNDIEGAMPHFEAVTRVAPDDAHAWYQFGKCLSDLDVRPEEALEAFKKALELEPALNAARYALAMHPKTPAETRKQMLEDQKALHDAIWEREWMVRYYDMGPNAEVFQVPTLPPQQGLQGQAVADVQVTLGEKTEWLPGTKSPDSEAIARQGRAAVVVDRVTNGTEDLFLPGAVLRNGKPGDLLLTPQENGWKDVTAEAGLLEGSHWVAAAGDLDNDGKPELVLAGVGGLRVYKNDGNGKFAPFSLSEGKAVEAGKFTNIVLADIDQDGDLDIFASRMDRTGKDAVAAWINISPAQESDPNFPNRPLALKFEAKALPGVESPGALGSLILADVDGDMDLDLVLLPLDEGKPVWVRNDRLMRFKTLPIGSEGLPKGKWQACMSHLGDLYSPANLLFLRGDSGAMRAQWSTRGWMTHEVPLSAGRQIVRLDLNLDGEPDLVTLGSDGEARLSLGACREGTQVNLAGNLDGLIPLVGATGDGVQMMGMKREGGLVRLGLALPGRHMIIVKPTGLRKTGSSIRSAAESVGTRVGALAGPYRGWDEVGTSQSTGQSSRAIRLGTGPLDFAQAIRFRWPDTVPQAELDPQVDTWFQVVEDNRKGTSCPVIFIETEQGWEYLTDCLGPGALGEQGPDGSIRPARPVETLRLPAGASARRGAFKLRLAEPMDEVMYLDGARVAVVDHPVGTEIWADERFNFTGPTPSSQLLVVGGLTRLSLAEDGRKRDILNVLDQADGQSFQDFPRRSWLGMAGKHHLDLRFPTPSGTGPLVICAEGGVDYPYPESINAATQAGVELLPPTLSRLGPDGKYQVLGEVGFPAGLPKAMLARLPEGAKPGETWRLESNLRVYWDRLRLGRILGNAETEKVQGVTVRWLDPEKAVLDRVGFAKEIPAGPLVAYDGNSQDYPPTSKWNGPFTRLGDVKELVAGVDDRLVVCGPGEAVDLSYALPEEPPAPGMTRTLLVRVHGWCKDTSPTTLTGARVEPLPYRAMPTYPGFVPPEQREWTKKWNTRSFR